MSSSNDNFLYPDPRPAVGEWQTQRHADPVETPQVDAPPLVHLLASVGAFLIVGGAVVVVLLLIAGAAIILLSGALGKL